DKFAAVSQYMILNEEQELSEEQIKIKNEFSEWEMILNEEQKL
ncbi:23346_t:CDS:2, partial [Dentiscutata erythropus]